MRNLVKQQLRQSEPLNKEARQEFVRSNFLQVSLISMEKKWVHHNRYVLEVTTDKQNLKLKKKYNEIRRFSEEVEKNLQIKDFALDYQLIRSNDQYKAIEGLMKKLNENYLMKYIGMPESERQIKDRIRNFLFNLLFYNEEIDSDTEEYGQEIKQKKTASNLSNKSNQLSTNGCSVQSQGPVKGQRSKLEKFHLKHADSNEAKVDRSLKEKSLALATNLVANVMKKVQNQHEIKDMFKTINLVWLKVGEEWHECRLTTNETNLILHNRMLNIKQVIVMCHLEVSLQSESYDRVVLSHRLLNKAFELRLSGINKSTPIEETHNQYLQDRYLALYSYLKELSEKLKAIQVFNFVSVKMNFAQQESKPKELAFKIIHENLLYFVVECRCAFNMFSDSDCEIFLPVASNFGVVEVFISEVKEHGVIPKFKEQVHNITIPVQNIYDLFYNYNKPKRKTQIRSLKVETKHNTFRLNLSYRELSNINAYSSYDDINDRFEGNAQYDDLNRDEVRIQFNRLKRMLWTIELYNSTVKDVLNFKNKTISAAFYVFIIIAIIFGSGEYLIHYIVLALVSVMTYTNPSFKSQVLEIVEFFKLQNTYNKVESTISEFKTNNNSFEVKLKFDIEKQKFLENFELTMKKKRNFYKKYKRLQEMLLKSQNSLMDMMNILEKVKNLFTWYHHKKTYIFYCILLVALIVITFIPIRVILIFGVLARLKKGLTYNRKTFEHNWALIGEIYQLVVLNHKLQDMEHYLKFSDKQILKAGKPEYIVFERKLKEYLEQLLEIEVPPRLFESSSTINESKTHLCMFRGRYSVSSALCEKYRLSEKWAAEESGSSKASQCLLGYISNIPSDRNILGLKTEVDVSDKQIDEIEAMREQADEYEGNKLTLFGKN